MGLEVNVKWVFSEDIATPIDIVCLPTNTRGGLWRQREGFWSGELGDESLRLPVMKGSREANIQCLKKLQSSRGTPHMSTNIMFQSMRRTER